MTDIEEFDSCIEAAKSASDLSEKIAMLRKAVDLYKGAVFMYSKEQAWLKDITFHYEARYIRAVERLFHELYNRKYYGTDVLYEVNVLNLYPGVFFAVN